MATDMLGEIRIPINSERDVTPCVLRAGDYCVACGFSEPASRLIATAVSELARNIVKYAEHGSVRLRQVRSLGKRGVEVIVEDVGPGINDIEQAMTDSFSTSGTLGLGLPGVRRMMDDFDLRSEAGKGLRITARKWC